MSIKRMSLRFNLDNEADRRAWEHLQSISDSKNKAVIDALNASFEPANALAELIRQTIRECLSTMPVTIQAPTQTEPETVSEEESALLDVMDAFMGG